MARVLDTGVMVHGVELDTPLSGTLNAMVVYMQ